MYSTTECLVLSKASENYNQSWLAQAGREQYVHSPRTQPEILNKAGWFPRGGKHQDTFNQKQIQKLGSIRSCLMGPAKANQQERDSRICQKQT